MWILTHSIKVQCFIGFEFISKTFSGTMCHHLDVHVLITVANDHHTCTWWWWCGMMVTMMWHDGDDVAWWYGRWAIVKDARVAAEMAFYIQMNTLGSSHDAQQRGISILRNIMSSYSRGPRDLGGDDRKIQPFFHSCQAMLEDRWTRLRQALRDSPRLVVKEYDLEFCTFLGKAFQANPGTWCIVISCFIFWRK